MSLFYLKTCTGNLLKHHLTSGFSFSGLSGDLPNPCPSFPCFFGFPCFFPLRGIPCFFERFSFFSRDFRGSVGIKILSVFFGGFPRVFPKKQGKEGQGYDWTIGVPDNGNEWRKFRAVPRSYALRPLFQETFLGQVRVNFAQNEGHEKATEKPRKNTKKAQRLFSKQMRATKRPRKNPRKSHEKATSKKVTSNKKSSDCCSVLGLIGVETEGLLDYQGRVGDHFHCTVEPSPGHMRCRLAIEIRWCHIRGFQRGVFVRGVNRTGCNN